MLTRLWIIGLSVCALISFVDWAFCGAGIEHLILGYMFSTAATFARLEQKIDELSP